MRSLGLNPLKSGHCFNAIWNGHTVDSNSCVSIPSNRVIVSILWHMVGGRVFLVCLNPLKSGHCFNRKLLKSWKIRGNGISLNPLKSGHCFNLIQYAILSPICLNPLKSGHCFNVWDSTYKDAIGVSIPSNRVIVSIENQLVVNRKGEVIVSIPSNRVIVSIEVVIKYLFEFVSQSPQIGSLFQ